MKTPKALSAIVPQQVSTPQNISAAYPFPPNFLTVLGSRMQYLDAYGDASPPEAPVFLFLHGNPTSSYLWRNVVPYVEGLGRAVAPDLIGMGQSDKPDISYTLQDHYRYLEAFILQLNLRSIVLVVHDWGSALGFHFAAQHPERIRGIAFLEGIVRPFRWQEADFKSRLFFRLMRTQRWGNYLIQHHNLFIKQFLFSEGVVRRLTPAERARYNAPYPTPQSRKPIAVWPKEIPIGGTPARNHALVERYYNWLRQTEIPLLWLYGTPGMVARMTGVEDTAQQFKHIDTVDVGAGTHFLQEDRPHEIGDALRQWYQLRLIPVPSDGRKINR